MHGKPNLIAFVASVTVGLLSACASLASPTQTEPTATYSDPLLPPNTLCSKAENTYEKALLGHPEADIRYLRDAQDHCLLDDQNLSREIAEQLLAETNLALDTSQPGLLSIYLRSENDAPDLCCSLQGRDVLTRIEDTDLWGAQFRLKSLDEAMLTFINTSGDGKFVKFRGQSAPEEPPFYGLQIESLRGKVMDHELYSPQLSETRKLKIYLPPGHTPDKDWPVLYFADGDYLEYPARLIEPMINAGQIAPIIIVGLVSGQNGIVEDRSDLPLMSDLRSADYLPDFDEEAPLRFQQHMAFVTQTVMPWAESSWGAGRNGQRRGVTGKSNGGTFSLHAAYLNPHLFDVALPQSPGIGTLENPVSAQQNAPVFWLSGGTLEPYFMASAEKSAKALSNAGYVAYFKRYIAGHSPDQWDQALADTLPLAFPPAR